MASRLQVLIVRIVLAIASECWGKFLFSCFNLPGVLTLQKFFLPRPCRGAGERFNEPGGAPASHHHRLSDVDILGRCHSINFFNGCPIRVSLLDAVLPQVAHSPSQRRFFQLCGIRLALNQSSDRVIHD